VLKSEKAHKSPSHRVEVAHYESKLWMIALKKDRTVKRLRPNPWQ